MIDQENKRVERKETLGSVGSKDRSLCVGGKQERDVGPSNGGRCELSLLLYCKSCSLWFVEETVEHHCFFENWKERETDICDRLIQS